MKPTTMGCLAVLGVFALFVLGLGACGVSSYNGLAGGAQAVDASWAQVENVYQRRSDLVPNIVETVKGYMAHEKETLSAVIEARSKVGQITLKADQLTEENLKKFQETQAGLAGALQRLMVVSEQYPNLKADEGFRDLRATIEGSENRIAVERKKFNETSLEYNAHVVNFPSNVVAGMFGFKTKPFFKAEEGASKAPKVDFTGKGK